MEQKPKLTPWSRFRFWKCVNCGFCCRAYTVPLKLGETLRLTGKYGKVVFMVGGKFYLKKTDDKQKCIFLCYDKNGKPKCKIYSEKPQACTVYPFYIYNEPKNTDTVTAEFKFNRLKFYVYVDALCSGLYVVEGIPIVKAVEEAIKAWMLTEKTIQLFQTIHA